MRRTLLAILAILGGVFVLAGFSAAQTSTTMNLLSPTGNQFPYGMTTFTFQVTAADNSVPSGLVSYTVDGGSSTGAGGLDQNGEIMVTLQPIDVGQHTVVFYFTGNAPYDNSSYTESYSVVANSLGISISLDQTTFTYGAGGPVVNVTITGGAHYGVLTLYEDGVSLASLSPFTQDTAIFGSSTVPYGGTHQIYVQFDPYNNSNTLSSQSNQVQITVNPATPGMTLASSLNPAQYGNSLTFTAQMRLPGTWPGAMPTGTVDFKEGDIDYGTYPLNSIYSYATLQLNNLSVGTHTLTAYYSGDNNFAPVNTSFTETINPVTIATTTSIGVDAPGYVYNQPVNATVTVSASDNSTATGSVVINDGNEQVGSGTLTNGTVTMQVTGLALGSHDLVAIYEPTGSYAQSSSTQCIFSVGQAASSVQLTGPSSGTYGQSMTFSAVVAGQYGGTPTGTVSISDGTDTYGPFTVSNGTAMCTFAPEGVGTYSYTATYSGDSNFTGSSGATSVNVGKATVAITLSNLNQLYSSSPEAVSASDAQNLPVTVTYNGSSTAATNAGSYAVVATVNSAFYTGSTSGTLVIAPAPLSVSSNNATKKLNAVNPALSGSVTGVLGADGITATYSTTATTTSDVGLYPITATLADPNGKLANYTVSNTPGTLTIVYAKSVLNAPSPTSTQKFKASSGFQTKFTVYDANGKTYTKTAVASGFQIIAIDGVATSKAGTLKSGWTVSGGSWVGTVVTSSLAINHTYSYEIILRDGSTLKFNVYLTK